jgi:hypothetical protein
MNVEKCEPEKCQNYSLMGVVREPTKTTLEWLKTTLHLYIATFIPNLFQLCPICQIRSVVYSKKHESDTKMNYEYETVCGIFVSEKV